MTVAFEIKSPFRHYKNPKNEWSRNYRETLVTIWHVDPETDGSDDSCGWFIRPRHLDKNILQKIITEFDFQWDRTFRPDDNDSSRIYYCGWFYPNGDPHKSVIGITVSMVFEAARICLGRDKASRYMDKHLWEIIHLAENNFDSLFDNITRKFEKGCDEEYTPEKREERIRYMAGVIYSHIMRDVRPWYKHPKWHIHHWKIQIHCLDLLKRFLFRRCCYCGKRFGWDESIGGNWSGDKSFHHACSRDANNLDSNLAKPDPKCDNYL